MVKNIGVGRMYPNGFGRMYANGFGRMYPNGFGHLNGFGRMYPNIVYRNGRKVYILHLLQAMHEDEHLHDLFPSYIGQQFLVRF